MFPNVKFIGENEIKELEKESSLGKTFLIDFTEGKMLKKDGRLIKTDDIRSIRMWIEKKLLTEKYKYKIYKTIHKNPFEGLSGVEQCGKMEL